MSEQELKEAIDKAVCEWSMDNAHSFLESEQIDLIDRIAAEIQCKTKH